MIPRTSGQGLTWPVCATPSFAHTHTHTHTHTYIAAHVCTHLHSHCLHMGVHTHMSTCQCIHLFTQARNRFSGTHLYTHTQVCTACVCTWTSVPYRYTERVPSCTSQGRRARFLLGPPGVRPLAKAPPGGHFVYTPTPVPSLSAPGTRIWLWAAPKLTGKK